MRRHLAAEASAADVAGVIGAGVTCVRVGVATWTGRIGARITAERP